MMLLVILRFTTQPRSPSPLVHNTQQSITLWETRFSEFFLLPRSRVFLRSPGSPSCLVLLVNTIVLLLLATQENNQLCCRVYMSAMGVLYTTAQTMNHWSHGTQDPTVIPVPLAPITVHDIDEEGLSFYFWTISQNESTALHWNVAFDMCCVVAGGENMSNSVVNSCGFI